MDTTDGYTRRLMPPTHKSAVDSFLVICTGPLALGTVLLIIAGAGCSETSGTEAQPRHLDAAGTTPGAGSVLAPTQLAEYGFAVSLATSTALERETSTPPAQDEGPVVHSDPME